MSGGQRTALRGACRVEARAPGTALWFMIDTVEAGLPPATKDT
jgi:hypothetical protein